MNKSYEVSLQRLLQHEGGYTNDPRDPGGPTNFGITIVDYRKYVKSDANAADIRDMRIDDAKTIYRSKYWDVLRCDELPAGVDYVIFDYGVNSGVARSGKVLRRALGLSDRSNVVTDAVIEATRAVDAKVLIDTICDERLRFLQTLKTWPAFGKGWSHRVAEVRLLALAMVAGTVPVTIAPTQMPQPHVAPIAKGVQKSSASAVIVAGAIGTQQAYQFGTRPLVLAAIIAATFALAALAWQFWHSSQQQERSHASFKDNQERIPMWIKIKALFKNSVTIVWARIQVAAGLAMGLVLAVASDANVTAAIQGALQPKFIPYYVIAIGIITEIARRRTVGGADKC